jgi:hypothetical protein
MPPEGSEQGAELIPLVRVAAQETLYARLAGVARSSTAAVR